MIRLTAHVRNAHGIHCRPSAVIIREASTMASRLTIRAPAGSADLTSMTQLLSLGIAQGDEVQIRVSGPDEELAAARLKELFERRFDFPPRGSDSASAPMIPARC